MSLFHFKKKDKGRRSGREGGLGISRKYHMAPGRGYVVEESPPDISFDAFSNLVSTSDEKGGKTPGLAITRQHPELVRAKYGLEGVPLYWLATRAGEGIISPTNLGILTQTMVKFVQGNPNGVIILDGVEYLVYNNDFSKVLRAIDQVSDHISQSGCRLIVPVDPRAFDPRELALLERNLERLPMSSAR